MKCQNKISKNYSKCCQNKGTDRVGGELNIEQGGIEGLSLSKKPGTLIYALSCKINSMLQNINGIINYTYFQQKKLIPYNNFWDYLILGMEQLVNSSLSWLVSKAEPTWNTKYQYWQFCFHNKLLDRYQQNCVRMTVLRQSGGQSKTLQKTLQQHFTLGAMSPFIKKTEQTQNVQHRWFTHWINCQQSRGGGLLPKHLQNVAKGVWHLQSKWKLCAVGFVLIFT